MVSVAIVSIAVIHSGPIRMRHAEASAIPKTNGRKTIKPWIPIVGYGGGPGSWCMGTTRNLLVSKHPAENIWQTVVRLPRSEAENAAAWHLGETVDGPKGHKVLGPPSDKEFQIKTTYDHSDGTQTWLLQATERPRFSEYPPGQTAYAVKKSGKPVFEKTKNGWGIRHPPESLFRIHFGNKVLMVSHRPRAYKKLRQQLANYDVELTIVSPKEQLYHVAGFFKTPFSIVLHDMKPSEMEEVPLLTAAFQRSLSYADWHRVPAGIMVEADLIQPAMELFAERQIPVIIPDADEDQFALSILGARGLLTDSHTNNDSSE